MVDPSSQRHRQAVIVLTGGRSSRLGRHKPTVSVGGRTMLDAVLEAAANRVTVVVGSGDGVPASIPVIPDDRVDGGPVVGIVTGLRWLIREHGRARFDSIIVLAADQPFLTAEVLDRLVDGRRGAGVDLALFRDRSGRQQPLCAAWSMEALRNAVGGLDDPVGAPVRALFRDRTVTELPDDDGVTIDVDTEEALERARRIANRASVQPAELSSTQPAEPSSSRPAEPPIEPPAEPPN